MAEFKKAKNTVSWGFLIPYRALSILFGLITAVTFFASLWIAFGIRTFVYITYMVMYVMLIYGFWKMRKWVVTIMSCTMVFLIINNGIRLFYGTQKISAALMAFLFAGIILLFTYLTRSQLNGEFKNIRVLRVFIIFLLLSQILTLF